MELKCLQCGHEFDGFASCDKFGWHSLCPKCGGSFDVDIREGRTFMSDEFCGVLRQMICKLVKDNYMTAEVVLTDEGLAVAVDGRLYGIAIEKVW